MEASSRSLVVEAAVGAGADWHDPAFLPEMIVQDFFVFSPSNSAKGVPSDGTPFSRTPLHQPVIWTPTGTLQLFLLDLKRVLSIQSDGGDFGRTIIRCNAAGLHRLAQCDLIEGLAPVPLLLIDVPGEFDELAV